MGLKMGQARAKRISPSAVICFGTPFPEMRGDIVPVRYDIFRKEVR